MTIIATVREGRIELPANLELPDGTEVRIEVSESEPISRKTSREVNLPTFRGDGLQPGVVLDDSRLLRRIMEEDRKPSQLL